MGAIIVAIISVVGSFILVYLNSIKDRFNQKTLIRKEQLEKFYVPFYQMYCRGFLTEINLSEMGFETRSKFLGLMSENIHLMQPKSQAMYTDFYRAFLDLLEAEDGNPDYPLTETQQTFDSVFNKLSDTVLVEYKCILKKLYLPVPELWPH